MIIGYLEENPWISAHGQRVPLALAYRLGPAACECGAQPARVQLWLPGKDERLAVELLRRCAAQVLPPRVSELAARHGLKVHGVRVGDQLRRWGSCSETAGISLNWRLLLLAPCLQDHVILHELAHLRHFNHSPAFYLTLGSMDPAGVEHSRQLDEVTPRLIQLGRLTRPACNGRAAGNGQPGRPGLFRRLGRR